MNRYLTDKQKCIINQQESNHKKGLHIHRNQIDSIQDHHRNKKKKLVFYFSLVTPSNIINYICRNKCRCIVLSVCLLAILLCIVIATTLAILLSKKSTTTGKV